MRRFEAADPADFVDQVERHPDGVAGPGRDLPREGQFGEAVEQGQLAVLGEPGDAVVARHREPEGLVGAERDPEGIADAARCFDKRERLSAALIRPTCSGVLRLLGEGDQAARGAGDALRAAGEFVFRRRSRRWSG